VTLPSGDPEAHGAAAYISPSMMSEAPADVSARLGSICHESKKLAPIAIVPPMSSPCTHRRSATTRSAMIERRSITRG
jgi:hypothetical protein